ncbi:MAG: alpha/beta hydrolase [Lentimicrobiaceae bacterium]
MRYFNRLILFILSLACSGMASAQEMSIMTSDSVKLYVHVKGEGMPCLFIHGGPGQGSNYWEKLAGDMGEKHFKMIYLDQRGCGRSSSPVSGNYTIQRMIMDFEEVRKVLDIKEWLIMGHSFGGILQTYYAKVYPESIKGILMFNCTLDMKESLEVSYIPSAIEFFEIKNVSPYSNRSIPLATRMDSIQQLFMTRDDVWKLSFSSAESALKFGETYAGFTSWNADFSKNVFLVDDYMIDYSALTNEIDTPTLFVYGTKDKNVGVRQYLKVKFPNMLLIEVEGGHMEFIENENDYIKAIESFLVRFNID